MPPRVRRRLALALLLAVAGGCAERAAGPAAATAPVRVSAAVGDAPVAALAVEVTAGDLATPLVFNLPVADGRAAGTVLLPVGAARVVAVRAFDARGAVTHEGRRTIDVAPGANPPLAVVLAPRGVDVPITVTFGSVSVAVTPASVALAPGDTLRLAALVVAATGDTLRDPVAWATLDPAVATVSADGLLSGRATGETTIVASYAGVAGAVRVSVGAR